MDIATVFISEENQEFKNNEDYNCSSGLGDEVTKEPSKEAQKKNDGTDFCCTIDNENQDLNHDLQDSVTIDLLESSTDGPKEIYKSDARVKIEKTKSSHDQSQ